MNDAKQQGQQGQQQGSTGKERDKDKGITRVGHQGTNEHDVQIKEIDIQAQKDRATNDNDVKIAEVKSRIEELTQQIKERVELRRIEAEEAINWQNKVTELSKWCVGCVTFVSAITVSGILNNKMKTKELEYGRG